VLQLGYQLVKLDEKADLVKERIEKKGAIARDVTLDVQLFKPKVAKSLLDEITMNRGRSGSAEFQS